MFFCRVISKFLILCSLTPFLFTKNISQDNIDTTTKVVLKSESVPRSSAEPESCDLLGDTEPTLVSSGEACIDDPSASVRNVSLFEDDRYGYIIEAFINEMEGFWQEVKSNLLKEEPKTLSPDKYFEEKYHAMKDKFFKKIPEDLPQSSIDVIKEYEKRYNLLMLTEIMNDLRMKNEAMADDSTAFLNAPSESKEPTNKRGKEDIKGSIKNGKCLKKNFEDLFKSKNTKAKSFSVMNDGF